MTVKEYSIRLNVLACYTFGVASADKGKTKIFINEDMIIRDSSPKSYLEALNRA